MLTVPTPIRWALLSFAYLMLTIVVMLHGSDWKTGTGLKWDGGRYDGIVREYVDGGYSLASVHGVGLARDRMAREYLNRVLFTVTAGRLHQITGLSLPWVYRVISVTGFTVGALGFYALAVGLGAGGLAAFFAGVWLLINPGAYIIFEVGAHPDPIAIAFAAWALWCHRERRYTLAIVLIVVGTLAKASLVFLLPYVVVDLLLAPPLFSPRARALAAQYIVAGVAAYIATYLLISGLEGPLEMNVARVLFEFAEKKGLQALIYNFDVLWILWGAYLVAAPLRERLGIAAVGLVFTPLLFIIALDWWRDAYGVLGIFVMPASAAYVASRVGLTAGSRGVWFVLAGITALLLRLPARFDWNNFEHYNTWPLVAVAMVLAANELLIARRETPEPV